MSIDTDRLQAALTAAERSLALVQAVAGLGSWYVDTGSGRAVYSPETYRVLGMAPGAGPIDSALIRQRVHPDDLPRLRADRDRVLAGEPQVSSRFRFRRDDGRECWLESRVTLEPAAAGRPQGIVGTVRDVSEAMRVQRELELHRDRLEELVVSRTVQLAEASERAEAAGRAKRAFLGHASHEIRTPLNVIVSLAHLMQQAEPDSLQRGRALAIEQAARQLSGMIDEVLDLARAEGHPPPGGGAPGPAAPDAAVAARWDAAGAAAVDVAARLRQQHSGRRVLLAEDDSVNQLAMVELLSDVGLHVDTADDGREAVEMAARRPYALILLDLRMPRLDGVAAARTLRALPGLQGTPLVAISANTFEEDRQACQAAGMNDFLPKPIDVQRLYEVLLRWLEAPADTSAAASLPPAPAARNADPAAAELMAPLLGLEGIDAGGGLASVGGKAAVYRRLLRAFISTHQHDAADLQQLLHSGDAAAAGSLAHRLRGSAATLGLIDIETAAAALELALDSGAADAPLLPLARMLEAALADMLQRLHQALAG